MTTGIYAGSFDPITRGHLSVILQATRVFTKVIVAIGVNSSKKPLFSVDERMALIRQVISPLTEVRIVSFNGLLVDYCKAVALKGSKVAIVRGLRALSDFESEMGIASLNLTLSPETPTVFFPTETSLAYVSSSAARELALYEGTEEALQEYVGPLVAEALIAKVRPPRALPVVDEETL